MQNEKYKQKESTFLFGINQFTDLTQKEFSNYLKSIEVDVNTKVEDVTMFQKPKDFKPPQEINWRTKESTNRYRNKTCSPKTNHWLKEGPYETQQCTKLDEQSRYQSSGDVATFYSQIPKNEADLEAALVTLGPITTSVEASNWQFYSSGVYFDNSCLSEEQFLMKHKAVVVGYGEEEGVKFWIIETPLGEQWGENGYMRMVKNGQLCYFGNLTYSSD